MHYKSTFNISQMDCPSEERLIRMKLADLPQVQGMDFDIPSRTLWVYHSGTIEEISIQLQSLKLGTQHLLTEETAAIQTASDHRDEKVLLWQVLLINLFFFILESATGLIFRSMGLVADGMDMLADTLVYGLGLLAIGKSTTKKKQVAKLSGYFQLSLALWGFWEVGRRFLGYEAMPNFQVMVGISLLALIGNALCLYILNKSRSQEAHMQASMIFTSNDVIANLGVILAGLLVHWTDSKYPDLIVGTLVLLLVLQGARRILQLSR